MVPRHADNDVRQYVCGWLTGVSTLMTPVPTSLPLGVGLIAVGLYSMPSAGITSAWFTVALRMWTSVRDRRVLLLGDAHGAAPLWQRQGLVGPCGVADDGCRQLGPESTPRNAAENAAEYIEPACRVPGRKQADGAWPSGLAPIEVFGHTYRQDSQQKFYSCRLRLELKRGLSAELPCRVARWRSLCVTSREPVQWSSGIHSGRL